ncbi:complex I subunit 5 family protein [Citricoccus sp. NR2]|uniref:complex I subunit 5 family protein n=1 Tax=Citricoccus sp. NR2 TaxID=3004095 RepID=UPI0022DD44A1|nr:proton-conducting transporter membrane subunit [Citricoccus sp. NR2]WBL20230.1 proton-conducting transporter membrane subunit [Citricoccus sp. NR2]
MTDIPGASALLPAVVLLPVLGAVVCLCLSRHRQVLPGVITAALSALISLALAVTVASSGPLEHQMAGWAPPLGIVLRADGMAVAFIALAGVVGLATLLVASTDERTTGDRNGFWPLSLLCWSGLNAVFLAQDLFNAYVALEVLSLAAVGLVALGSGGALRAALRYLVVAVIGSMLLLVAIAVIYAQTGTLDMTLAGQRLDAPTARLALVLAVVGMGLKAAVVPMHAWLPPAHAGAPAAVSPLMSALVVKGAFYLLLRLWLEVVPADPVIGLALGILGAISVVWGSLMALTEKHLKRIAAYSTISQMGYLFLAFPLLQSAEPDEQVRAMLAAVITMALAHGLAKAALFLVAGALMLGTGTDHVDGFVGAARTQGVLVAGMIMAAVSLIGLPVSLGFTAKWGYLTTAMDQDVWWIVAVLLLGTLLAAGYLLRPIAALLRSADIYDESLRVEPSSRPALQRWVPFSLGAAAIATGFLGAPMAQLAVAGVGAG